MTSPTEPSASMRKLAHELREIHVALIAEGFSAADATRIVGVTLGTTIAAGSSAENGPKQ